MPLYPTTIGPVSGYRGPATVSGVNRGHGRAQPESPSFIKCVKLSRFRAPCDSFETKNLKCYSCG